LEAAKAGGGRQAKKAKLLKEKEDALMNSLFKVSKSDKAKADAKKAKLKEMRKQKGKDGKEDDAKKKKKKKKKGQPKFKTVKEEPVDDRPKEIIIEEKRAALYASGGANLTPVTAETFAKWKKKEQAKKEKRLAAERKAYEKETGRKLNKSGRELYAQNSKHHKEEAGAGDVRDYAGGKKGLLDIEVEEETGTSAAVPPVPPAAGAAGAIDDSLYLNEDLAGLEDLDLSDDGEGE
jgi:hypothetical protein